MKFCDILKELRLEGRLTHEQLAKNIGWSKAIIGDWERGRSQPTAGALIALARYFGVSVDYLLGLESDDNPPSSSDELDNEGQSSVRQTFPKTKDDKELLGTIEQLNRNNRTKLLGFGKCLLEQQSD